MNLTEATILALQGKLKLSEDVAVSTDNQSVVSVDTEKTTIFTPEETVTVEPVADEAKIQEVLPEETKEEPVEKEVKESTTKKRELTESNNESISDKVIDYVQDMGMESDFVAEFQQWASKGLLDRIKEDIITENDTRYFVLEDLSPDDEEYQEIEEMSDAELYDKLEDEGYFDQDDLNTIWFDQIQDIGRSNLNEFCSDFDSLYLNGEFTDEEDEDEDDEDEDELDESKSVQDISAPTTEEKPLTESKEEDSISEKVLDYVKENGLEADFVLAFRKWIGTDKENEIKAYIVRENDGREYALEGFLPDEEEYKEIENMSDAEIYDKIEDESYMEQDEINALWMDQIEYQPTDFLNDFCSDYNRVYLDNALTNLEESKLAQDDTEEETTKDELKDALDKIATSDSKKQDFVTMVKAEGTKRLNEDIIEIVVNANSLRDVIDPENKELTTREVYRKATKNLSKEQLAIMYFNACYSLTDNEDLMKLCKKYINNYLVESDDTSMSDRVIEYVEENDLETEFVEAFRKWIKPSEEAQLIEYIIVSNEFDRTLGETMDMSEDELDELTPWDVYDKLKEIGIFDEDAENTIWMYVIKNMYPKNELNDFCVEFNKSNLDSALTKLEESKLVQEVSGTTSVEEKLDKIIELLTKLVESPKTEEVLIADEKPVADEPKEETEANVEEEKVDLKSFEERMLKKYNHIAKVEAVLKAPKAIALECLNKSGKKSRLVFTESKAGLYRTISNIGLVVENKDNTLVCKRIIKNKRRK